MSSKLWIFEEQTDLRTLLSYLLQRKGFDVSCFQSLAEASEALERVQTNSKMLGPEFVIVGFECVAGTTEEWMRKVRAKFSAARVVCICSDSGDRVAMRLKANGILSFERPTSLAQVLELLRSSIGNIE